ncbi:MAG: cytochrome c oxidase subunit II, partial [Planctomycetia bacterium]|nr:cytochrome c oxidase subunit II [Planctomycetia bacterium]
MTTFGLLPIIPEQASTLAEQFEYLFWYISIVTGVVGTAVYAAMLYFCVRYRRGATTGSTPRILGSTRLELTWTVVPLMVFLTFYAWGAAVFNYAAHPPEDSMEVFVIGKQWMWKAQYPNGQRVIIGGNQRNMTSAERDKLGALVLPVNRPVKLTLISEDVIHDFGVPAFRSKIDVLPGRYTSVWYHPTKEGTYDIFCDQYCGLWHSLMVGQVKVVSQTEFDDWLAGYNPLQGSDNAVDGSLAHEGRQLFLKLNCIKCHTGKSDSEAPILEGLWG